MATAKKKASECDACGDDVGLLRLSRIKTQWICAECCECAGVKEEPLPEAAPPTLRDPNAEPDTLRPEQLGDGGEDPNSDRISSVDDMSAWFVQQANEVAIDEATDRSGDPCANW